VKTVSRRAILRALAAGAGVAGLGALGCRGFDPAALAAPLRDLARNPESLAAVGKVFLAENPEENLDTVTEWLAVNLDWDEATPADELTRRLVERVRHDFRDSRTVRVDNWLLSETEARWTAAVALAAEAPAE